MMPAGSGGLDERAKRLLALALMGGNARHVPVLVHYDMQAGRAARLPRTVRDEAANTVSPEEEAPSFEHGPRTDHAEGTSGAEAVRAAHGKRPGGPRVATVEQAREMAVREAKAYIANADIEDSADEDGFYAVYKPRTGEIRYYRGPEAGRPGKNDFEFAIRADIGNDVLLVTAHNHPRGECNRANEIRTPRDLNKCDRRLWKVAPFVVRNPSGEVVVLDPPETFKSLEWLNRFHAVDCEPDPGKCR